MVELVGLEGADVLFAAMQASAAEEDLHLRDVITKYIQ
jgi:hypothetical protein